MLSLLETYLRAPSAGQELEARYKGLSVMKRYEYVNIVRCLASLGFVCDKKNQVLLRIYANDCRVEIEGFMAVQAYCSNEELPKSAVFLKKGKPVGVVDSDYGMRLALSRETEMQDDEVQTLRRQWTTVGKKYRYVNRTRLTNAEKFPCWAVDCSITKSSYANVYRFSDSDLFSASELCEVEAEALPLSENTAGRMLEQLKKLSTSILGGLQGTPYPVTHKKIATVLDEYRKLCKIDGSILAHQQFIAPNPVALQHEHLKDSSFKSLQAEDGTGEETYFEDNGVSIRRGYAVTDKADGTRKMLFIGNSGELFFLTSRLGVENVNCVCTALKGTLLDGEFIDDLLYTVFDVYFFKGEDCRMLKFHTRSDYVKEAVRVLEPICKYRISAKNFYEDENIFDACAKCLSAKYPYKTDGLIFTPVDKAVGVSASGVSPPNRAYTWDLNFKWKPPLQTTIDFLVKTTETLDDKNLVVLNVLCRGNKNWALPQTALLEQVTNSPSSKEGIRPFMTEDDPASHLCYLPVVNGDMVTVSGAPIKSGDVVEFVYQPENQDLWKWQATKVRVDKDMPNTFVTAYNNWHAIQFPISEDVIKGLSTVASHKYYLGNKKALLQLRTFHRFVKMKALEKVVDLLHRQTASAALNLFDVGVGQAGDLGRWRNLKLNFVFGIDLNRDNIVNRQDGACIRYLTTNKSAMRAIFAVGDASKPLFELTPPATELDQLIVGAVFGKVPREQVEKFPNLSSHYNSSFSITSCMFCLHYMFESMGKLTQFVDNIAACTATGGYFVGAAWDGKDVFALLRDVKKNESLKLDEFTLTKRYSHLEFEGDPVAVGYAIDVSQKTFNLTTEYLVDYQGLTTLLLKRGFKLVEMQSFRAYYSEDLLSENEKKISFMNNVFIFEKIGIL
jgi:hypothetical protein